MREDAPGERERTRANAGGGENERTERTPSTSATRFNYTLQTHDMSKSYTSYRLCHLLKVSSRAPRSRHRCSAELTPFLSPLSLSHSFFRRLTPKTYIGRKARNIRTKSSRKERREGKAGGGREERGWVLLRSTQLR